VVLSGPFSGFQKSELGAVAITKREAFSALNLFSLNQINQGTGWHENSSERKTDGPIVLLVSGFLSCFSDGIPAELE
jgi:hypothetical protein